MEILVSVVIPVHNGEKYMNNIANRVLRQSLRKIELILVENYSEDNSLKACKALADNDDRVTVLQSFDRGTSFARKKGIEAARGKYTFFVIRMMI